MSDVKASKKAKGKQRAVEFSPSTGTAVLPLKKSKAAKDGHPKGNKASKSTSKGSTTTANGKKNSNGASAEEAEGPEAALRREIAELGGDDADYDFVKDVDNSDEDFMMNETVEDVRCCCCCWAEWPA